MLSVSYEIAPLLKLTPEERLEIIDQLWESMPEVYATGTISDAKYAEVLRRKERYEADPDSGRTLEQVIEFALRDD